MKQLRKYWLTLERTQLLKVPAGSLVRTAMLDRSGGQVFLVVEQPWPFDADDLADLVVTLLPCGVDVPEDDLRRWAYVGTLEISGGFSERVWSVFTTVEHQRAPAAVSEQQRADYGMDAAADLAFDADREDRVFGRHR